MNKEHGSTFKPDCDINKVPTRVPVPEEERMSWDVFDELRHELDYVPLNTSINDLLDEMQEYMDVDKNTDVGSKNTFGAVMGALIIVAELVGGGIFIGLQL